MTKIDEKCPFCKQTEPVKKHGLDKVGFQRFRCQTCCRTFQARPIMLIVPASPA